MEKWLNMRIESINKLFHLLVRHLATWVPSTIHSPLPEGAILAGHDQDSSPIYIGSFETT